MVFTTKKCELHRMIAVIGVTAYVASSVVFGQYPNPSSQPLAWKSPAIHGQQAVDSQQTSAQLPLFSPVQLVQHVETNVSPNDETLKANSQLQPINGVRIAQSPGSDAYNDTVFRERSGRAGTIGNPNSPNDLTRIPAPSYPITPPPLSNQQELNVECRDPRDPKLFKPISELSVLIDVDVDWSELKACPLNVGEFEPRQWQQTCFRWVAPANCVSATYFEDVAVERYGHSWGPFLQPVVSAGKFYGSVLFLPYKMGLTPPCECVYSVGYYRPGSCAPYMIDPLPFSIRAGLMQAGATVGLAYVIP
ncbi:MAG: hypothetical protein LBJ67_12870 [Planctomycetaceae bacterium]|jgi:hypothetical protein|nr:hypothetical protein [Planctomycetaceae bacterium]